MGGSTDLPGFCDVHGGAVVSTTVDKWVHVVVAPRFEGDIRVAYSRTEIVDTAKDVEHELVREALRTTGLPRGLDILTLADVVLRYGAWILECSDGRIAERALRVSGCLQVADPVGRGGVHDRDGRAPKADWTTGSIRDRPGGPNLIEFLPNGRGVRVEPLVCPPRTLERLQRSMLFFFLGTKRSSNDLLLEQARGIADGRSIAALTTMRDSRTSCGRSSRRAITTSGRFFTATGS